MNSLFNLNGKQALVTGAGSGIGAAIVAQFLEAGAMVWGVDRDAAALERLRATCLRREALRTVITELGSKEECDALAAQVLDGTADGLHILVNNAGIGTVGTVLQTSAEELGRLWTVNVNAVYRLCGLFLPAMIARRSGSIINIASIGGVVGLRDRAAYCTTKFAVVGLTKAMALDHAEAQVRVNCICPARVETPFVAARIREYPDPAKAYQELSATQPVGRMGKPEEIAAAAVYLASDEAAFITGSALVIDGGFSAGR